MQTSVRAPPRDPGPCKRIVSGMPLLRDFAQATAGMPARGIDLGDYNFPICNLLPRKCR